MDYLSYIKKLLDITVKEDASDLDISVNYVPHIRITGQLVPLSREKQISEKDSEGMAFAIMSEIQRKKFLEEKEIDFSYNFEDRGRFRVNVFYQRGSVSLALRFIPSKIRTIEELNLPPVLHDFTSRPQGLVLVTGATNALRATFRQNPDVIMVGEMRDLETISTTITAAETGHLVFATLHTNSSAQTIHRVVDVFPGDQQNQIRFQLASSLLGIISQRLLPRIKGGFIPVCEVMLCNNAISTLIRENKIHELPAVIETSAKEGMISFSRALVDLVRKKEISLKNATDYATDPSEVKNLLR